MRTDSISTRIFPLVLGSLLLLGACASRTPVSDSISIPDNAIAYVDTSSRVWIADMNGDRATEISRHVDASEDAIFAYPAWSPAENGLAFVGVEPGGRGTVYYAGDGELRSVYEGAVSPFFLSIADTGGLIGVLGSHADGGPLALLAVPTGGGRAIEVTRGSPLYWEWVPGKRALLANVGNPGTVSHIEIGRRRATAQKFDRESSPFRTPAVSTDRIAYVAEVGGPSLMLSRADGSEARRLMSVRGLASFSFAPESEYLAVSQAIPTSLGIGIGPVSIVDLQDGDSTLLSQQAVAYYWSPDGTRIAYLEPVATGDGDTLSMILSIYYVDEEVRRILYRFRPSPSFLQQVLPFYDQYERAARFWSPDSSEFIVHALRPNGDPGIYIVPVSDSPRTILAQDSGARLLAEGLFATWSFR